MATYNYVQGDTGPQIQLTLTEQTSGDAIDLTGATVELHFRAAGSTTLLFTRALTSAAPTTGVAVLQWQAGDLDVAPGIYEGEVETVLASGVRETLYDKLRFKIRADFA